MTTSDRDLIVTTTEDGITTLRMNNPRRLNGWTMEMMAALRSAMGIAASDPETAVVILTGTDPYYCAGVNLGAVIELDHPQRLHEMIEEHNRSLFELFLDFPKPILVAVNGPAIGASVTSATLCDAIIASDRATFSTPFARLGVPPEGCSSMYFPRLLGEASARRMLGEEGFQPTGEEAEEIGLVRQVVPHEELMDEARRIAASWIEEGRERSFRSGATRDELKSVNAAESRRVADAFLGAEFLLGQFRFLWGKGKHGPAMMFLALYLTRPLWSQLLS